MSLNLFKYFISVYHYPGWSGTVGETLKYLILDKGISLSQPYLRSGKPTSA